MSTVPAVNPLKSYSTEELANLFKVKPNTIRHGLCTKGHYLGLKPCKLANRLLVWPAGPAEKLLQGE